MAKISKHKIFTVMFGLIFAVCVTLGVCFFIPANQTAYATESDDHDSSHNEWLQIESQTSTISGGESDAEMTYYFLDSDVELQENLVVSGGYVTLCLNGHKLTGNGNGSVITVSSGAYFVLCDCQEGEEEVVNTVGEKTYNSGVITGGTGNLFIDDDYGDYTYCGGGVFVSDNSTFEMNGGIIAGNQVDEGRGGGVYVARGGTFEMNSGTITDNESRQGGGVFVSVSEAKFTMNGGEITNNTTTRHGGGIYANGDLIITSGTISGNYAGGVGGGIYQQYNTFTMSGGTITQNESVGNGGGVFITNESIFTMENGEISYNTGSNGGGVIVSDGCTFTMNNGTIKNNNVTGIGGAGVYVAGTLIMTGGDITGNTSTSSGAGVYVASGGSFTMESGNITENNATSYGGGVYVASATFSMTGGKISKNNASQGGGVYVNGFSSVFTMSVGEISYNETSNYGGGVYIASGTFTMNSGSISNNTSSGTRGGGVCINSGTFTMKEGTISENTSGLAGGVYVNGTFNMEGGTITSNYVTNYAGGGVFVSSSGIFTMTSGTISYNQKHISSENDVQGGGVSTSGTFIMNGGEITQNIGHYGGGVCVSGGTFTMNGGSITSNSATWGGGGVATRDSEASFIMNNGTITGNTASVQGGGVCVISGSFTMEGGEIFGNEATRGGGVCVASGYTFNMNGGTITDNSISTELGYEVLVYGTFNMTGGDIIGDTENIIYDIWLNYDLTTSTISTTTISGGRLDVNIAIQGDLTVSGGYFSERTKSLIESSNLAENCSVVKTNSYDDYPYIVVSSVDDIHDHGDGDTYTIVLSATGGELSAGNYYLINDVALEDNIIINGVNVKICLNGHTLTGVEGGSVITLSNGATLVICDCSDDNSGTITGGTGTEISDYTYGGGIYVDNGSFTMNGGTISGNSANYGSAVYVNGTFTMTDGYLNGSVYIYNGSNVSISGGYLSDDAYLSVGEKTAEDYTAMKTGHSTYAYVVLADEALTHDHDESEFTYVITELGGTIASGESSETMIYYYLYSDVTLKENITISGGFVTICLNGHKLTGNGNGSVITLTDGAYFVLCDCSDNNLGTITGGTGTADDVSLRGGGVFVDGKSTFIMQGGTISVNDSEYGVYVDGTFTMTGGYLGGTVTISNSATAEISGGYLSTEVYNSVKNYIKEAYKAVELSDDNEYGDDTYVAEFPYAIYEIKTLEDNYTIKAIEVTVGEGSISPEIVSKNYGYHGVEYTYVKIDDLDQTIYENLPTDVGVYIVTANIYYIDGENHIYYSSVVTFSVTINEKQVIIDLIDAISALEKAISDSENTETLAGLIENLTKAYESAINDVSEDLKEQVASVLSSAINAINDEINEAIGEIDSYSEEELEALIENANTAIGYIESVASDITSLDTYIAELETNVTGLQSALEARTESGDNADETPTDETTSNDEDKNNVGLIVGLSIAAVVVLAGVIVVVVVVVLKKKQKNNE